jgi:hypothetical protein
LIYTVHCRFAYLLTLNLQVERIFADRVIKADGDDLVPEYLVKWQGLTYAEST